MTALVPAFATRAAGADNTAAGVAATGADTFPAGPNTYLRVKNANAAPCVVTINPAAGSGPAGTTIAPLVLTPSVAASTGDRTYGPFPQNPFGDQSGNVNVACAPFATVTLLAYIYPSA
jgi:hypothetical protein